MTLSSDGPLHIVVIGGGITGCATAAELANEGHDVTLLEQHRIAAMASGWTLGGVRQSGRHPAELPLARAAVALWAGLRARLGTDVEYRRDGNLRLARTPEEVGVIRALVEQQQASGLDVRFLPDAEAINAIAPAISRDVLAASFCPTDGHANPILATQAFAEHARARGARIREGVGALAVRIERDRVAGVATTDGDLAADRVVIAAGIHTPALIEPLGLAMPLSVKVVHVVQSEPLPPTFAQVFGVANADCAGRQQVDGRLRFTGGIRDSIDDPNEWSQSKLTPSARDVRDVVDLVARVLPIAGTTPVARTWSGLIDLTPDALPVIDAPAEVDGLVIAAGFSGHGFCLGPVSGALCADLALGRTPRHDLSAFRLDRDALRNRSASRLTLHG